MAFNRHQEHDGPVNQSSGSHKSKRHSKDHKNKITSKLQIFGVNKNANGDDSDDTDTEIVELSYTNDNQSSRRINKIRLEKEIRDGRNERVRVKVARMKEVEKLAHYRSLSVNDISLTRLQFGIEKTQTNVVEEQDFISITTPWFGAVALVAIPPLQEGVSIQVGWVQMCTNLITIDTYGEEGMLSLEVPELNDRTVKFKLEGRGDMYPWFDVDKMTFLQGPIKKEREIKVDLATCLTSKSAWEAFIPDYKPGPRLTFIYRKQDFLAYLVFKDFRTKKFKVLKKISWSMEVAIAVDPEKPLGQRAEVLGLCEQKEPKLEDIPSEPFLDGSKTVVEDTQITLWRPKNADPRLLNRAKEFIVFIDDYLESTRDNVSELYENNRKNFLLKQKSLLKIKNE